MLIDSLEVQTKSMLGKGGNGEVFLAVYRSQKVALKTLLKIDEDTMKKVRFECLKIKELRHPNIVELVGVCWDKNIVGLCLEFVPNSTLEHWLRKDVMEKMKRHRGATGSPKNDDLLNDSSRRTLIALKQNLSLEEAIFTGWTAPPMLSYKAEDLELMNYVVEKVRSMNKRCDELSDGWRTAEELNSYASILEDFSEEKAKSFKIYVRTGQGTVKGVWESFCTFEVNMCQDQWMAGQMHVDNHEVVEDYEWLGEKKQYGYLKKYKLIIRLPLVPPRCTVYKGLCFYIGNGVYLTAADNCETEVRDERTRSELFTAVFNADRRLSHSCGQL